MIGQPLPDPRQNIITELEKRKEQFFSAGNSIQEIPAGLSAYVSKKTMSSHEKMQRAERAKLAPEMRKHAEAGMSLNASAKSLKIRLDRAQMIASENEITYAKYPDQKSSI